MSDGSVFARGDVLWVRFRANGKQHRHSTGYRVGQEALAEEALAEIKDRVNTSPDDGETKGVYLDSRGRWRYRKVVVIGDRKIRVSGTSDVNTKEAAEEAMRARLADADREHSRQVAASGRTVAFKLYSIAANGAETEILHDTVCDDHRTYELTINGSTRGIWIAPLAEVTPENLREACSVLFDADELGPDGLPIPTGAPF